jgi:hypothetical protein
MEFAEKLALKLRARLSQSSAKGFPELYGARWGGGGWTPVEAGTGDKYVAHHHPRDRNGGLEKGVQPRKSKSSRRSRAGRWGRWGLAGVLGVGGGRGDVWRR